MVTGKQWRTNDRLGEVRQNEGFGAITGSLCGESRAETGVYSSTSSVIIARHPRGKKHSLGAVVVIDRGRLSFALYWFQLLILWLAG